MPADVMPKLYYSMEYSRKTNVSMAWGNLNVQYILYILMLVRVNVLTEKYACY